MSDQSADTSPPDQKEEPAHHASSELVPSGNTLRASEDIHPDGSPSKDIVLQRLTPHSSWDCSFGDPQPFGEKLFDEKAFEEALREPALPAPDRARRALPLAAMIAIATAVGAISGAAATFGVTYFAANDRAAATAADAIAKFNADLASVKANVETTTKSNSNKLAKLNETVDKLKSSEVTGSIAPPLPASVPSAPPSVAAPATQFGRLPIVDGWVLREVADGGALIEGQQGVYEVFAGDPLPGVGRIEAIRRQDGRWIVVTTRGLIVAR
ncbi:MAG TPA: hypothetical protein VGC26_09145 [Afipia sp.]